MARKSAVEGVGGDEGGFDAVASAWESAMGVSETASSKISNWFSSGYAPFDHILSGKTENGGFPSSKIVELAGAPSSSKTFIATQAMISVQKMGGAACFLDLERSIDLDLGRKLGLDTSPGKFSLQTPKTWEDSVIKVMKGAEAIRSLKNHKKTPLIFVLDSLAAAVPQSQYSKSADAMTMADTSALARTTSMHFKTLALLAHEYDFLYLFLNQIRTKPGVVYGSPEYTTGGEAPKFASSIRVMLKTKKVVEGTGDDRVVVGSEITAYTEKNKVSRPHLKASWNFRFQEDGSGLIDIPGSFIDLLEKKGVLETLHGQRVVWTDGSKPRKKELAEKLNNPEGIATLEAMWRETIDIGVGEEADD